MVERSRSRPRGVLVEVLVALAVAAAVTATLGTALLGRPAALGVAADGAPPDAGDAAVATSQGFRVWAVDGTGRSVRWDPCRTIALVVDPTEAPPGALDDLAVAVALLVDSGGPPMVVEGTTDERPSATRRAFQPERYGQRWAPVLVAWVRPGATDLPLGPEDRGIALPTAVRADDAHAFVTGQVVLNAARPDLVPGFADRADAWGATLLHELGHLVGLGHVDDPGELMSVRPGRGPVRLGPGDLAGLAHLSDAGRCVAVPRPRDVPIAPVVRDAARGVSPGR